MKVRCSMAEECKEYCDGAIPHEECPKCRKGCDDHPDARCVPVDKEQ